MALNTPAPTALGAIQTAAKARGLAWQPLAAVAHFESGLNPQSIGDGGHAFGLFQNNNAGGTITGDPNPRRFLNPNVSANYTADAIKRLGIQSLSPQAQVAAIVNRYERPANPGREIAGAQSYLATLGAGAGVPWGDAKLGQNASVATASTPGLAAPALPSLSLAPLQQSLSLGQAQSQRALDALGKLSGRSVEAQAAPDLSTLTAAQTPALQPTHPSKTVSVKPGSPMPAGLDPQEAKVVELAKSYLGDKYVFGGSTHKGIDCSGLIAAIYSKIGVNLPHNAAAQFQSGKPVALKNLQPGQPVFFRNSEGIHHVGLYIGGPNNSFIQAPHTGDVVKISSLNDPYYAQQFAGGRDYL